MPRKNNQVPHTRTIYSQPKTLKKRFPTRVAAERAAELRMLENPGLTLSVYQDTDKGWYLTSKTPFNY